MYYGEIKNCDIANGEGVRVTLFVSGCTNRCKNCFQPQTWAFDYGQPFTAETEEALLQMLAPAYINGLTLLGGEPFEPENQRGLLPFLRRVRERLPGKTVWAFTGFTWEQLHTDGSHPRCEVTDELLSLVDVLVDGRFVEELHDISLRFRGSSNQRIIDVPRTLSSGGITLWEDQETMAQVKIKKLDPNATIPTSGSAFAAGYDLYACLSGDGEVTIPAHHTVMVPTGIAVALPEGTFGGVFARSGLASREGLRPANCVGVVDSDYRGECFIALHNDAEEPRTVRTGDRIAQLVLLPYLPIEFDEVADLPETARGEGGFGSTGR